jgi:2'-5' RNA ligase
MRAFIAIDIPAAIRQKIFSIYAPLIDLPDKISWVKSQNMHLTLRFLGETDDRRIEKVKTVLRQVATGCNPFIMVFTSVGVFPNAKKPRIIWLGLDDTSGQLIKLQYELETYVRRLGFAPETRKFSPHLTLGRIRELIDGTRLMSCIAKLPPITLASFKVEQLSLIRSQLRPQGPLYSLLDTARLG